MQHTVQSCFGSIEMDHVRSEKSFMTMTMDLFQLRAHEGQKIIGEILHTMMEHN